MRAAIETLDAHGTGIGRTEGGRRAQVRGALPGETVEVDVEHVGRDGVVYGRGRAFDEPSPDRVPVVCPHFLDCGGCDLLHLRLDAQRDFKRAQVAEALGLELQDVLPTISSPRDLGYRAMVKLVVGPGAVLGSYRPRTHDLQDMRGCRVHAPEAERIADAIRDFLGSNAGPRDLRYVLIRASIEQGRAVVTLVRREATGGAITALVEHLAARTDVARVVEHINADEGDALWSPSGATVTLHDEGPIHESIGPVRQTLEAGAFVQVNPGAAARLYERVVSELDAVGRRVLDLYSGSGGVGLAALQAGAGSVIAVESVAAAAEAARQGALASGVGDRFEVWAEPVEAALRRVAPGDVERVVLNPPRRGAGPQVVAELIRVGVSRLVYVSCNPRSLGEDARALGAGGYRPTAVIPVDLFPQTRHVETVWVAERSP